MSKHQPESTRCVLPVVIAARVSAATIGTSAQVAGRDTSTCGTGCAGASESFKGLSTHARRGAQVEVRRRGAAGRYATRSLPDSAPWSPAHARRGCAVPLSADGHGRAVTHRRSAREYSHHSSEERAREHIQ